ncbi:hypothetical protein Tco_0272132 [Tanacetum coccineum]
MGGISIYLTFYTLADMHSIFTKWIVSVPGIGGSLAVVAAMHSRTTCLRLNLNKKMYLEPHVNMETQQDPYAKTAKRGAVLAEEQRKTAKKEKLDNKRKRISKILRMLLDLLRTRVFQYSKKITISEVHYSANEERKNRHIRRRRQKSYEIAKVKTVTYDVPWGWEWEWNV